MNVDDIQDRLKRVAHSVAVDEYTITEFSDSVQLKWMDEDEENVERIISVRETPENTLCVEANVWHDDYSTGERKWFTSMIATVGSDYPTVLSEALQRAIEVALNTSLSQLEVVDGIPPQEN